MNDTTKRLIAKAAARKDENDLPYAGALLPAEAAELLAADSGAKLIDVRTVPELVYVGRVPDAAAIEWQSWPDMAQNPHFLTLLERVANKESPALFLCRSGARSHYAAAAAAQAGWQLAVNVLEGFEGGINGDNRRGFCGGWRFRGLPWEQS
ncbi:MAG: rhodanese-like domain-containing protein [Gammaproteobacteria bacterium]